MANSRGDDVMEKEQASVNYDRNVDELIKKINRLQKKLKRYEDLAESLRAATVIDRSIYTGEEDGEWLSIGRDDYARIMEALSKMDLWKPWQHTLQSRITK
jgi:small-conductance mechanosensitive channel